MRRHAVRLALALAGTSCGFAAAGAFSALLPLRGSAQLRATLASAACRGAAPQHAAERLRGGGESMAAKLGELGQGHLLEGLSEDKQLALLAQAEDLDSQLPGGLEGYIRSAKKLLQDSKVSPTSSSGAEPPTPPRAPLRRCHSQAVVPLPLIFSRPALGGRQPIRRLHAVGADGAELGPEFRGVPQDGGCWAQRCV